MSGQANCKQVDSGGPCGQVCKKGISKPGGGGACL